MLAKDTACEARGEIFKLRPLTSEKLAFGCALFNVELDTGMIQKTMKALKCQTLGASVHVIVLVC